MWPSVEILGMGTLGLTYARQARVSVMFGRFGFLHILQRSASSQGSCHGEGTKCVAKFWSWLGGLGVIQVPKEVH